MPVDTFWSTSGQNPAVPVLNEDSPGYTQNPAQTHIPGTAKGAIPTEFTNAARFVYPHFDGTANNRLPEAERPSTFSNAPPPSAGDFVSWHSAYQVEWLRTYGNFAAQSDGAYFQLSSDGVTPVNLMSLTLSDYAKLSAQDKINFSSAIISTGVASRLGLSNDKSPITQKIKELADPGGTFYSSSRMSSSEEKVFVDQVRLIEKRVNIDPLVSAAAILQELTAIEKRFDRAKAFADAPPPREITGIYISDLNVDKEYYGTVTFSGSKGGGAAYAYSSEEATASKPTTVQNGFQEFMRAERAILTMKNRRDALSTGATFRDPKMDVPNLIYQLQLLYEAEADGIADSGTEEVRQLHKLLQDYGIMQRLVNETMKNYDTKKPEEKRRFMDIGTKDDGSIDTDQTSSGLDFHLQYNYSGGSFSQPNTKTSYRSEQSAAYPWFLLTGAGGNNPMYGYDRDKKEAITPPENNVLDYVTRNTHENAKLTANLTAEEMRVVMMFSDDAFGANFRTKHPIEILNDGLTRPTQKFLDETDEGFGSLALFRKNVWDQFSTQLSDTVTLLNQRNQIKQNEIENATKRQNRHFELGNNALRKMNDMIMTIGRM